MIADTRDSLNHSGPCPVLGSHLNCHPESGIKWQLTDRAFERPTHCGASLVIACIAHIASISVVGPKGSGVCSVTTASHEAQRCGLRSRQSATSHSHRATPQRSVLYFGRGLHSHIAFGLELHRRRQAMSLPSFPSSERPTVSQPSSNGSYGNGKDTVWITGSRGPGAGNLLPKALLIVCGVCSLIGKSSLGTRLLIA